MEFTISVTGDRTRCIVTLKNDATNEHMEHYLKYDDVLDLIEALNQVLDHELEDTDDEL